MVHPRLKKVEDGYSQDWEIFRIMTSDMRGLPSYIEMQTTCNVEDIYNILEMLDAKFEMDEVARIQQAQQAAQNK
ncbi:hypothetical protein phiPsa267_077 [Pseudomonas phage phiPsa267]|uniref:Uncharacterized protein n=8 Tax=Otagovirus TaxID=2560197 RepID=A0A7G9V128_9CAUD|nr:hypothetical protein CF96_gp148 [Pseudomonas phage phiPsa374]YP_010766805.1 hypothetical protein QGX14_gp156 [Pseudomonas phage psageK4]YP_010766994.1 hypothetical protein QGX15_gp158 [Pseudomonas phage psageK4e]YP_010767166.1 hypothetical protein QGX16_gp149 [Pseudomonas phage phiPsa397]YP_010767336.1 hypothetical protein QGX17_gp151 [Pseudomonas phage phiPsa381]YP_010767511.1 hypothetical protein QGX18_gp153 [Pseudomonas phage phiPsa347]YP_010767687.1 hypothetical protein QGX19_gp153 [Ps